jgi:hypothetical protein
VVYLCLMFHKVKEIFDYLNNNTCLVSTYQVERVSSGTFSRINSIANQNRVEL